MNTERLSFLPFSNPERLADAYAEEGFVMEAEEVLRAHLENPQLPQGTRDRLGVKLASLALNHLDGLEQTPEAFTQDEHVQIREEIEAIYGNVGELLETQVENYRALQVKMRTYANDFASPKEAIDQLGWAKGLIAELTFQALAARTYSYNSDDSYGVPAPLKLDYYGRNRASDLVFYHNKSNTQPQTRTVTYAQVKFSENSLKVRDKKRTASGLSPRVYDPDIAMLMLSDATNAAGQDLFQLDPMTLPRAILAELEGTVTPQQKLIISKATTYMLQQVQKASKCRAKHSRTTRNPKQVGA